ncbi:phage regulatory CII family protein [Pseudoduganella sp. RAF19]|uniref:phage regulatory CII family protein n=1 Tax=Bacteria TaxID=2 RepID=UPI003F99D669
MHILDAFHKTVHDAKGGVEALAVRLGISAQILRNKANPNITANKVHLEEADRVMALTEDYEVLHALARNHGFVCVKVHSDATASDLAVLELVAKVWVASGEVGKEVHATLEDGVVDKHEVQRVEEAVYRVNQSLSQMVGRLKGMAEK